MNRDTTDTGSRRGSTLVAIVLVIVALSFAFLRLAAALVKQELAPLDQSIMLLVRAHRSAGLTIFMRLVTIFGSPAALTLIVLIFVTHCASADRMQVTTILMALVGGLAADQTLKLIFRRARPEGYWLAPATGFSFPSGHSLAAIAVYFVLAYFVARGLPANDLRRSLLWLATLILVTLVGVSRVYLGVHYPSDVAAGFAAGAAWAMTCIFVAAYSPLHARRED